MSTCYISISLGCYNKMLSTGRLEHQVFLPVPKARSSEIKMLADCVFDGASSWLADGHLLPLASPGKEEALASLLFFKGSKPIMEALW